MMKNFDSIPKHIAFILDGNRRWAKSQGKSSLEGHREAVKNITRIIDSADNLNVKYLTFYVFSSENWNRSVKEVKGLMSLLESYIKTEGEKLIKKNFKITFIGNLSKISSKLLKMIENLTNKSNENSGMNVIIALSYGGREEIVNAAKKIAVQHKQGTCSIDEINDSFFEKFLYTNVPNPDLLIRTGGDIRVSNFLLWQIAYTELYFIKKYWPDFTAQDLEKAILEFQNRERRYGR